jgi:hypothetical protein
MSQITTCTFFKLESFSTNFGHFLQMQLGHAHFKKYWRISVLQIVGSGAENGFSSKPNFGTYALLCIWVSEIDATTFFWKNSFFNNYKSRSSESLLFAHAAEAHGNGTEDNLLFHASLALDKPVMVLTRASIRLSKLFFLRKVKSAKV